MFLSNRQNGGENSGEASSKFIFQFFLRIRCLYGDDCYATFTMNVYIMFQKGKTHQLFFLFGYFELDLEIER